MHCIGRISLLFRLSKMDGLVLCCESVVCSKKILKLILFIWYFMFQVSTVQDVTACTPSSIQHNDVINDAQVAEQSTHVH